MVDGIAVLDETIENDYNINVTINSINLKQNKSINGGGVYVAGGNVTINSGIIENCSATDGGAIFISNGDITMNGGNISNNQASENGGVAYVSGGNFKMTDGTISYNQAKNGGAVYVNDGQANITYGNVCNNEAENGGAIYIVGGDFLMTSGVMKYNSASNEGGAVYAKGGSIIIGIQGCTDESIKHESPKTHPEVTDNTAIYGGGGFMTDGTLTLYCGVLRGNASNNEGTGNNIYMNGGTLNLDGGTVGEETNPGVVLVGGKLNDTREDENQGAKITMVYHPCLEDITDHKVSVTVGKYVNLPAAQEGWTKAGYTMVGWTTSENITVRTFDDYKSVGMAVKVDGADNDGQIHYYAVWAKTTGNITYELNGGTLTGDNASTYNYSAISKNIKLNSPEKQYYTFIGWELTASEDSITNWEIENGKSVFYSVADPESGLDLNIGTHFGDITLTAIYELNVSNIEIVVDNSITKNQSFIFEISGTPNDGTTFKNLKIVVVCDENGYGRANVNGLPVGTYTITVKNNWSWRYKLSEESIQAVTNIILDKNKETYTYNFDKFNLENSLWLNEYSYYLKYNE